MVLLERYARALDSMYTLLEVSRERHPREMCRDIQNPAYYRESFNIKIMKKHEYCSCRYSMHWWPHLFVSEVVVKVRKHDSFVNITQAMYFLKWDKNWEILQRQDIQWHQNLKKIWRHEDWLTMKLLEQCSIIIKMSIHDDIFSSMVCREPLVRRHYLTKYSLIIWWFFLISSKI